MCVTSHVRNSPYAHIHPYFINLKNHYVKKIVSVICISILKKYLALFHFALAYGLN